MGTAAEQAFILQPVLECINSHIGWNDEKTKNGLRIVKKGAQEYTLRKRSLNRDQSRNYYKKGDFSDIHEIYSMDFSYYQDITDVSMLGNVHTLNLDWCLGVTGVSALGNVPNLRI